MSAKRLRYLPPAAACLAMALQVFWPVSVAALLNLSPTLAHPHPVRLAAHAAAASLKNLKKNAKSSAEASAVYLDVAVMAADAVAAAEAAKAEVGTDADVGEVITGWDPSPKYPLIELPASLTMRFSL